MQSKQDNQEAFCEEHLRVIDYDFDQTCVSIHLTLAYKIVTIFIYSGYNYSIIISFENYRF